MGADTNANPRGIGAAATGLLLVLAFLVRADEPPAKDKGASTPPWQRMLTGADAKQAEALQQQIDALLGKGEFADAVKPATQLWELRQRRQGPDHWQAADAQRQVNTLQAVAAKPAAQRRALTEALAKAQQAQALRAKGRYRDEEPLREQALAGYRQVLGEDHPDTALPYNELAYCRWAQGCYAQAEPGFAKALAI